MLPLPPEWVLVRRRLRLLRRRYAQGWRPVHWKAVRRRTRRALVGVSLAVVFAACLGGAWAALLVRSAPGWWVTVGREDPEVIRVARTIENRIFSRASQDAGERPAWTVEIPAREANAWLNVRLPMWLANQKDEFRWPREMSDLQVNFADNRITIGARVRSGERDHVLTATIEPRLSADGRLFIPARWVGVGRLSIPAEWVLDEAQRNAERYIPPDLRALPETESLFRAFQGDQAIRNTAVIQLPDGRRVRILAFSTRNDRLRLTCRTETR